LPGTAKVIAIFVLALKENAAEVRASTAIKYLMWKCYETFFWKFQQGAQIIQQYSRWILLSWTFTFRLICQPLKKLYPDLQSLQNAGKL
jgi:hypothetical protein